MRYLMRGFIYGPGIWLVFVCVAIFMHDRVGVGTCIIMAQLRSMNTKE